MMRKAEAGDARWKAGGGRREVGEGERARDSLSVRLSLYVPLSLSLLH